MSTPTPALVSQRAARRLPRAALLLLCAAYLLPGVVGRDPWRGADLNAFGTMLGIAQGRSAWFPPTLGGLAADAAWLPYWLGAGAIRLLGTWVDPALAARVPFALLLGLVLALTWYSAFHLARTDAAQPVAFAFGGEAEPLDYARAVADAALLALIACLGLLQLGHETTPELAQLFGAALFLWSLAAAPFRAWRARAGAVAGLLILAGSAAPSVSLALAAAGAFACVRSESPHVRGLAPWIGSGAVLSAMLAWSTGAWAWRVERHWDFGTLVDNPRLWAWFMWPAWLLAAWTLWRWRRHLQRRHVAVPLVSLLVPMLASIAMGASDRALLLGLPGVAVLAAFALPTLNRSTSAAIDWFSMILFTLCAVGLWAVYLSLHVGVPPKPALHVERLLPGFVATLSWPPLLLASAATACWVWLVRWRTGRHREALWKSLVLPAGGVALCWLLLMTLGLPLLDYARSYRTLVERVARHVPRGECIAAPGQFPSLVAALEHHGGWRVDARPQGGDCRYLVRVEPRIVAPPAPGGWRLVAKERRPVDRNNLVAVYVREPAR